MSPSRPWGEECGDGDMRFCTNKKINLSNIQKIDLSMKKETFIRFASKRMNQHAK